MQAMKCPFHFLAKTLPPSSPFCSLCDKWKDTLPDSCLEVWLFSFIFRMETCGVLIIVSMPKDRTFLRIIEYGPSIAVSLHCKGKVRNISIK